MGEWQRKMHRDALARAAASIEGYPGAKEKLDELTAALTKAPSAESQWAIVALCDPSAARAMKPLRWIEGLPVMLAKYPEHKAVTSGLARWMLFHACRAFEMHEKSVEVLDEVLERHPDFRVSWGGHGATATDVLWQKAESYVRLGLLQDEHKDPHALGSCRKAIATFELFRRTYPDHKWNHPTEWGGPHIETRVGPLGQAIGRLSR